MWVEFVGHLSLSHTNQIIRIPIIFTIINKFASAAKQPECYNPSENIIVVVDEGHRSQGG
ncbi:MAG: hypothetical protein VYE34_04320 [Pseudomonadota bacterium]|uniref:hypothetical protein n=1 Tax=Vreelandella aquamarina TaxID=77097 RepID=UPI001BAFA884|nr:hypothetical protein [Halomonas axialensis]MEC9020552.1 hypothetical protein [Pseudomonadota bacterium]